MIIDCGQCTVRGAACAGCAVTFVTETGPAVPAGTPADAWRYGRVTATASRVRSVRASRSVNAAVPPGSRQDASGAGKSQVSAGNPQVSAGNPQVSAGNPQVSAGKPQVGEGEPTTIELDADEMRALAALADAGMIPPLRYAPPMAKVS